MNQDHLISATLLIILNDLKYKCGFYSIICGINSISLTSVEAKNYDILLECYLPLKSLQGLDFFKFYLRLKLPTSQARFIFI